jgi:hypothetical protein
MQDMKQIIMKTRKLLKIAINYIAFRPLIGAMILLVLDVLWICCFVDVNAEMRITKTIVSELDQKSNKDSTAWKMLMVLFEFVRSPLLRHLTILLIGELKQHPLSTFQPDYHYFSHQVLSRSTIFVKLTRKNLLDHTLSAIIASL